MRDIYKKLPNDYTNKEWQNDLQDIKSQVTPSKLDYMPVVRDTCDKYHEYHGKTQYQCYCSFINDILHNIRKGNVDYCFYIYQILDLLKYEYDNLNVNWLENSRCFSVSLTQ